MDNGISPEQNSRAALRFNSSESLLYVIEDVFVKPSLHYQFAARGLYLYLRTEEPVKITPPDTTDIDAVLNGHDSLEVYNAGIAQSHKGYDLYRHNYPLSSRVVGGAEYNGKTSRGLSLLFQLAVDQYEKNTLLAPPFNHAKAGSMYITAEIDEECLIPGQDRERSLQNLRDSLGAGHRAFQERGRLPDSYYVTKPSAIMIHPHLPPSQAK